MHVQPSAPLILRSLPRQVARGSAPTLASSCSATPACCSWMNQPQVCVCAWGGHRLPCRASSSASLTVVPDCRLPPTHTCLPLPLTCPRAGRLPSPERDGSAVDPQLQRAQCGGACLVRPGVTELWLAEVWSPPKLSRGASFHSCRLTIASGPACASCSAPSTSRGPPSSGAGADRHAQPTWPAVQL